MRIIGSEKYRIPAQLAGRSKVSIIKRKRKGLSMKRFLTIALLGAVVLGMGSVANANYCSFDAVPAATLLFPFVAFDYEGGFDGDTTQLAITNVSSEAQIVHITVWTDYSVAILDFNLTMTGYDVTRMNIRDILALGLLPTEDADTGRKENIWWDGTGTSNAGGTPFDDGPWSSHNELHDPRLGQSACVTQVSCVTRSHLQKGTQGMAQEKLLFP